jgi:predicted amidophosphoribosyltransferase
MAAFSSSLALEADMNNDAILAAHIAARTLDYNLSGAQVLVVEGHDRSAARRFEQAKGNLRELAAAMGYDLTPRLDAVKAAREVA